MHTLSMSQHLEDQLKAGKVIPFVGAGDSMDVNKAGTQGKRLFPSWSGLLRSAAVHLKKRGRRGEAGFVLCFLRGQRPDYLQCARFAREALKDDWYPFLKKQLDHPYNDAEKSSLSLARSIWSSGDG